MPRKSDRTYRVAHSFYARAKKQKNEEEVRRVFFTRANQHLVTDLLTDKQIREHVEAGNLIEPSDLDPMTTTATGPNTIESEREEV